MRPKSVSKHNSQRMWPRRKYPAIFGLDRRESWKPQDIGQTERILEGVAPLLTMSAVDRIIDFASQTRRGSSVAFDYVHADALEGRVEAARKPFAYLTRLGS